MRVISRNPFARGDRVRRHDYASRDVLHGCAWCGLVKMTRIGEAHLYQYGWWADDKPGPDWLDRGFCSIGCFRSFYDMQEV